MALLRAEHLFSSLNAVDVLRMFQAMASAGLGRQIIMICKKSTG